MGRRARKRHPRSLRPWSGSSWWGGRGEETEGGSHAGRRRVPPPGQPQVGEGQAVQVASGGCTLAGKSSTRLRTQNGEQGGRGRLRGFVVAGSGPPWPTAQEGPAEGSSPHTDTRKPRGGWEGSSGGRGSARGGDPVRDVSSVTGLRGGATHPFLAWDTHLAFSPKRQDAQTHKERVHSPRPFIGAPAKGREWGLCGKGLEELQCPPRGALDPCRPAVC